MFSSFKSLSCQGNESTERRSFTASPNARPLFFAASQRASELLDKAASKHPFHSYTTPKWPHYASSNTAAVGFSPVQGLPVDNVLGVAVVHALEHLFEK